MPVFDFLYWAKDRGSHLETDGSLIQVEIGLPQALEDFCVKNGIQIPTPVAGYALIDTGASATARMKHRFWGWEFNRLIQFQPIDRMGMGVHLSTRQGYPSLASA